MQKDLPVKVCPVCKNRMTGKPISRSDGYIKVEYSCRRRNCARNGHPIVQSVKA